MSVSSAGWRALDTARLTRLADALSVRPALVERYFPAHGTNSDWMMANEGNETKTAAELIVYADRVDAHASELEQIPELASAQDSLRGAALTLRGAAEKIEAKVDDSGGSRRQVKNALMHVGEVVDDARGLASLGKLPESSEAATARLRELVQQPWGQWTEEEVNEAGALLYDLPEELRPAAKLKTFGRDFRESATPKADEEGELLRTRLLASTEARLHIQLEYGNSRASTARLYDMLARDPQTFSTDEIREFRALYAGPPQPWVHRTNFLAMKVDEIDEIAAGVPDSVERGDFLFLFGKVQATTGPRTKSHVRDQLQRLLQIPSRELTPINAGLIEGYLEMSTGSSVRANVHVQESNGSTYRQYLATGRRLPLTGGADEDWAHMTMDVDNRALLADIELAQRPGVELDTAAMPARLAELAANDHQSIVDALETRLMIESLEIWPAIERAAEGDDARRLDIALGVMRGQLAHFSTHTWHQPIIALGAQEAREVLARMTFDDPSMQQMASSAIEKFDRAYRIVIGSEKGGYQNFPDTGELGEAISTAELLSQFGTFANRHSGPSW